MTRIGRDIARIGARHDPVQTHRIEPVSDHLRGALGGETTALDVGVDAPAHLALTALGARQAEHELADHPAGLGLHGGEHERVAVRFDPRLREAPLELGACLIEGHRLPGR